jgi:general secretion pathway protein G
LNITEQAMTQSLAGRRGNDRIRRSPEDGYTLIELLIVLTIISLIVSVIGPRFLSYLGV